MNTQKASFYLRAFIDVENTSEINPSKKIRLENLQLVLAKLLDKDGDGFVTPKEIQHFF